jgi:hypothetical protein
MEIKIGNNTVEFYSSSVDLPILRFQAFQKHMMISNEVGSTFEDYDMRTVKTYEFLSKGMAKEALIELNNRRQMVYNAFNENSPRGTALALLVKSIDGELMHDYSEMGISKILKRLDEIGFTAEMMYKTTSEVKKKSKRNWKTIFRPNFRKVKT